MAVTKAFDSYTTNLHYLGETVLVWIIGCVAAVILLDIIEAVFANN